MSRLLPPRLAMLAAVALLTSLLGAASAGAVEPGVVLGGNFFASPPTFQAVNASGARWVRAFMYWSSIEPRRGQYDEGTLRAYEQAIANLAPQTKVLFVVVGTPSWANASNDIHTPPTHPQDYADFMHAMAARFAGKVAAWEIWNEEDASQWWTHPDPGAYARLLEASYPAVKSADSQAQVILGGLTGNDYNFLEGVYGAGAKGSFDAVGVHTDTACGIVSPYSYYRNTPPDHRIGQYTFLGYREVHNTMLAHSDDKPIWMTELGWSTSTQICDQGASRGAKAGGVSLTDQATYLAQAYHCLQGDPYVAVGIWFDLQDTSSADTPFTRFGLLGSDFSPKPAFSAFADFAAHGDHLTGACGNFTGPQVAFASPRSGARYGGALKIAVSAASPAGVNRITLLYDAGKKIRNFTDKSSPTTLAGTLTWQGAKHLSPGRHKLTVEGIDAQGNVSEQTIVVTRTAVHHQRRGRHRRRRGH